jgi:acyl-CoA reductase-like NAD-dependent aldehyde dehydrogenase
MNDAPTQLDHPRHPNVDEILESVPKQLLIDGKWVAALSGRTFATIDPTTETEIAQVSEAAAEDVDLAVAAARRAFQNPNWSAISPYERARLLLKVADLIEADAEKLATLDVLDNGMILGNARAFVYGAAACFRYYAGWTTKIHGQTNPSTPDVFNYSVREPLGVCALIIPWNVPVSAASMKIAPALACGNTVVLKPAEQTPLTALALGQIILDAGIPPGVVNIINGFGETAGAALANHPNVDKVAFTGSTEVGKKILQASVGTLKRVTLELGGKSPNVIFPDADIEAVLASTVNGFCQMAGQMCIASSRIFVHQSIHDEFVEKLAERVQALRIGDPFAPDTTMGPLVSKEQLDRVSSYFNVGAADGATLRSGGEPVDGIGYFVKPTIYTGVRNEMRIAREEIFGPVAAVLPFRDEEDAILQGNDTSFGLAAAVWTRDIGRAIRVAHALKAGTVWINTYLMASLMSPFGGYKQSGIGREMGEASLDAYTQIKSVFAQL